MYTRSYSHIQRSPGFFLFLFPLKGAKQNAFLMHEMYTHNKKYDVLLVNLDLGSVVDAQVAIYICIFVYIYILIDKVADFYISFLSPSSLLFSLKHSHMHLHSYIHTCTHTHTHTHPCALSYLYIYTYIC